MGYYPPIPCKGKHDAWCSWVGYTDKHSILVVDLNHPEAVFPTDLQEQIASHSFTSIAEIVYDEEML